jgi:hypothetical protein
VAVTGPGTPLDRILTGMFGQPSFQVGALLVWRR